MKKIYIILFLTFLLSSCNYVNENKIIEEKKIDIDEFLNLQESNSIEEELKEIEEIDISVDDLIDDNELKAYDINENEINELIEILFNQN